MRKLISTRRMRKLISRWPSRALLAVLAWTAIGWIFALPSLTSDHWYSTLRM